MMSSTIPSVIREGMRVSMRRMSEMGHCCEILVFPATMSKQDIEKECFTWQAYNCDPYECGRDGPMDRVNFTYRSFDSRDKAFTYLDDTFGNYDQTAVRFKEDGKEFWAVACEVHC